MMLGNMAKEGKEFDEIDVKISLLHRNLSYEVFMEQHMGLSSQVKR